jgi:hemerythrin-like domain-containing protein
MAMNAQTLASSIAAEMEKIYESYQNGDKDPDDAYLALATAIVNHIQTSAVVSTNDGATGTIA